MANIQIINKHAHFANVTRHNAALKTMFKAAGLSEAPQGEPFTPTTPTIVLPHSVIALAENLRGQTPPQNAAPIFFVGFNKSLDDIRNYLSARGVTNIDAWAKHMHIVQNVAALKSRLIAA